MENARVGKTSGLVVSAERLFGCVMKPDDVDLQILRCSHGWSLAQLWINGEQHKFTMTHIFGEPIEPLISTAVQLSPSMEQITFDWLDEPGCHRWTFRRVPEQRNLFTVDVASYADFTPTKNAEAYERVTFTTDLRFWKALVYSEVAKIRTLLAYSLYSDTRSPETFPHRGFRALEKQVEFAKGDDAPE